MRILLIGSNAREHAIASALARSPQKPTIVAYGFTKNPGIARIASDYAIGNLEDGAAIVAYAQKQKVDFAFIGPENPIAAGIADALADAGIPSVAPLKTVARLESSKGFTRDLLKKYNIPGNPLFRVFKNTDGLRDFIVNDLGGLCVVKYDALKGGKGVKVMGEHLQTVEESCAYAATCIAECGQVVIEEKLIGEEFSLMSFTDGVHVVDMPAVQDHKRAFDGDTGPNTGGMGTISDANHSLPFLRSSDLIQAHTISEKVVAALYAETGVYYKGILYGGFMATKNGVRVIEYNSRFGDPESLNVLPLLETDFVAICQAIIAGTLTDSMVRFAQKATVCNYLVPEGYPDKPLKGVKITIDDAPIDPALHMYYAYVDQKEDDIYLSASRAMAFVGEGATIQEAAQKAASGLGRVQGPVFYRKDIGTPALLQKRIDHMRALRGA